MIDGKLLVEKIMEYAKSHLHLQEIDETYVKNSVMYELKVYAPFSETFDLTYIKDLTVPDEIFSDIKTYAVENGIVEEAYAEIFATYVMGLVTPKPSDVNYTFNTLKEKFGSQEACSYLFDLSVKNNYVQKTAIERNILWEYDDRVNDNKLEITINLSKPEKDNKEVAKLLQATPKSEEKYPKCFLCKENEGFSGTLTHPARSNLRVIRLTLGGEKWYLQYSPYQYFEEHCIVFGDHVPMSINPSTINKLLDFVDLFPNYFIGSNADLPIVGGSILNHEHFQGGKHLMPMHYVGIEKSYTCEKYNDVEIGLLKWYNTVIHLVGYNKNTVSELAGNIIEGWKNYADESVGIYGLENGIRHNTVTPIVRILVDGRYCIDLILRNNQTSEEYPDGIYHAHPEYHNIKKEGIGLIEAMGLYILPARLKRQMSEVQDVLCGNVPYDKEAIFSEGHSLYVHRFMIEKLKNDYPNVTDKAEAERITKDYINNVCSQILFNTAVFKKDEDGSMALTRFLNSVNIK